MFLYTEKNFLESLVIEEDPADYFKPFIIKFLTENNRLRCITDKVCFIQISYHISLNIVSRL
jgi:hypothetical protein